MNDNHNSPNSLVLGSSQADLLAKYKWEQFFLNWRVESSSEMQVLWAKNDELLAQNDKLEAHVAYLARQAKLAEAECAAKSALKTRRQNARKRKVRDAMSADEFETVLSLVKGESYAKSRTRIALVLLYYTGLRVSNLLVLKKFHIDEFVCVSKQNTTIPLIKGGSERHYISIGSKGRQRLLEYNGDLQWLLTNKAPSDFVFTPESRAIGHPKALSREHFDKGLNSVLVKASAILGKHLRTHSFRATFITDMLQHDVPIQTAKEIVGHKDIKSTVIYQRCSLGHKEIDSVICAVNRGRHKKRQR